MKNKKKENYDRIINHIIEDNKKISFWGALKNGIDAFKSEMKAYKKQKAWLKAILNTTEKIFKPILSPEYEKMEESELKENYKDLILTIQNKYLNISDDKKNEKFFIKHYILETNEYKDLLEYLNTDAAFEEFKKYVHSNHGLQSSEEFTSKTFLEPSEINFKQKEFVNKLEKFIVLINKATGYGEKDPLDNVRIEILGK